jgi:hypothetical protein
MWCVIGDDGEKDEFDDGDDVTEEGDDPTKPL